MSGGPPQANIQPNTRLERNYLSLQEARKRREDWLGKQLGREQQKQMPTEEGSVPSHMGNNAALIAQQLAQGYGPQGDWQGQLNLGKQYLNDLANSYDGGMSPGSGGGGGAGGGAADYVREEGRVPGFFRTKLTDKINEAIGAGGNLDAVLVNQFLQSKQPAVMASLQNANSTMPEHANDLNYVAHNTFGSYSDFNKNFKRWKDQQAQMQAALAGNKK